MAYNPKTGDYEGMGEYEHKISNIKLGMGDFEISIAQVFIGGKLNDQEVALISPNRDYEIHPFYDLESLIEVLTAINKKLLEKRDLDEDGDFDYKEWCPEQDLIVIEKE